jgi:hypothetical protein
MDTIFVESEQGNSLELMIKEIEEIGRGRAARVILLENNSPTLEQRLIAEKRYSLDFGFKSWLTKRLYGIFFQSPFPYSQNYNAIKAAYYIRKVLKILLDYWRKTDPDIPKVADALYTRWDNKAECYCLGTEYIEGRNVLTNEIDSLVYIMEVLNEKLINVGLIGAAWQVESGNALTGVATSNFIFSEEQDQWYWIDAESGVVPPSMKYFKQGKRIGCVPIFDDIDFDKLKRYVAVNFPEIMRKLCSKIYIDLTFYIKILQEHHTAWKETEIAVLRHALRLIKDKDLQEKIRNEYARQKLTQNLTDDKTADEIRRSGFRYITYKIFSSLGDFFVRKGRKYINNKIDEWEKWERLSSEKAQELRNYLVHPDVQEYLKDVGYHIFSTIITPPLVPEAISGSLFATTKNIEFTIPVFISPILRSIYSIYRLFTNRERWKSHVIAGIGGAVPTLGNLPYYITQALVYIPTNQKIREISKFLVYTTASKIGEKTPFFGGLNTRWEHTLLKKIGYSGPT